MKILVVDDDPAIREYLEEVLNMMGHKVVSVKDGYDAIDYVKDHDINLAYIDVDMPGIDGFATLKKIREIDPKVSSVMISDDDVNKLKKPTSEEWIYVSLKKPFTIEQIEEINKAYEDIQNPLEVIYDNPFGLDAEKLFGAKVLIVDDKVGVVTVIKEYLEWEGFNNLDTAKDGEEAIKKFNKKKHDVVVADIVMPKKSGIEILRHVKAVSENSQVIIITANADKDSAITALKLGAYDYIEKPMMDLGILSRIVLRAVEKKLLLDKNSEKVSM
jgi:DNA-binding NtrC family response regulator